MCKKLKMIRKRLFQRKYRVFRVFKRKNGSSMQFKKLLVIFILLIIELSIFVNISAKTEITKKSSFEYETEIKVINDRIFIDVVSKKNSYAIKVDIEGTVIKNLNIRNSGPGLYTTGIKISASHVTIENCNVFDTPVGIAIWTSHNTIVNCTFWGCEDEGIVLFGQRECNNNTFINCVFYNCSDGVELQYSSNNTFINCRFLNNYHAGVDGIWSGNNNNSFFSCVFVDNMYAIYFQHSKDNEFVNCTFRNNVRDVWEIT